MERHVARQRSSLAVTAAIVIVGLAASLALLLSAVDQDLPEFPGLDIRTIQIGLVLLSVAFVVYAVERERNLRSLERRLEAERAEGERLRAMDEVKNAFLRSISHDLRSPLTVILGTAQLLEARGEGFPAERLTDAATQIRSQAQRLDSMLTDILDLERVARGIVALHAVPCDVGQIVRTAVDDVGASHHPVEVQAGEVRMRVDGGLVARIVDNLVRNAVKYTPVGTPIQVRVEGVEDGILLSVEDRGPGVDDANKEIIFELFGRGYPPEGISGTGVGLSLVRQFAQLHGGRAWVEDRPGGGAAFRVVLAEPRSVPAVTS